MYIRSPNITNSYQLFGWGKRLCGGDEKRALRLNYLVLENLSVLIDVFKKYGFHVTKGSYVSVLVTLIHICQFQILFCF